MEDTLNGWEVLGFNPIPMIILEKEGKRIHLAPNELTEEMMILLTTDYNIAAHEKAKWHILAEASEKGCVDD